MYIGGTDIGGTKIEFSIFQVLEQASGSGCMEMSLGNSTRYLRPVAVKRCPTERALGYEKVMENFAALVRNTCEEGGIAVSDLKGIGIGLPGTVCPIRKTMINGNTQIFVGRDITGDLSHLLGGTRVEVDNDANCFALAEVLAGAGVQYRRDTGRPLNKQLALGVILGTGVGAGLCIGSTVITGRNGAAGEVGHTELVTGGHACYCGKNGCTEMYLSGPAIEGAYASRMYSQIAERPAAHQFFEMAAAKEPLAIALVKQHQRQLAKFFANLSNLLDLDYIVCGGGLSKQPAIYEGLEALIARDTYTPGYSPKIYKHQLGDSAGGIGAALLCVE